MNLHHITLLPNCAVADQVQDRPDLWHDRCRGEAVDIVGHCHVCGCPCHRPGYATPAPEPATDTAPVLVAGIDLSPVLADGPPACACCGEPTRGGQYLPGHSTRLQRLLLNQAQTGDQDALVEYMLRGWWRDHNYETIDHDLARTARDRMIQIDHPDRWLAERTEARHV